jgi:predicted transcriptional regulator
MKIDAGIVKSVSKEEMDMAQVPMNDEQCLKKLNDLDVFGIFQFETKVAIGVIKQIGIHAFQDMYAATTLGRPDPLSGDLHVKYGRRKRDEEDWISVPAISDIMDQSYGLPIYQESCCVGDTIILTPEGEFTLKDVVENKNIKSVVCLNDEGDLVEREIIQRQAMGEKEVFELTFDDGKKITCTADHKILTSNKGYVQAELLEEDDDIVCI